MDETREKDVSCRGNLDSIVDVLNDSSRFLLTSHIKPDGDAIGSMLGLGLCLEEVGREVEYYAADAVPKGLEFLPGSTRIKESFDPEFVKDAVLVILDCNEPARIGDRAEELLRNAKRVLVIDHHLGDNHHCLDRKAYGLARCQEYICTAACSTAEIIVGILDRLGWTISRNAATGLYTGLVTDTGSFRHSNTDKKAFETAVRLLDTGIDNYWISNQIYQRCPKERLELLALVLKTLEIFEQGRFALIHCTPKMFEVTGASEEDTTDFIGYARSIDTVEVAAFVKEVTAGQVAVSLRSKEYVNVQAIAKKFGGGGHFHAAGFRKNGSAHEIREELIAAVHQYFESRLCTSNV